MDPGVFARVGADGQRGQGGIGLGAVCQNDTGVQGQEGRVAVRVGHQGVDVEFEDPALLGD